MDPAECPLPEVAEALQPYIKPRGEVLRIRNGLQQHLDQAATKDGSPLTNVNLANPNGDGLGSTSPSMTGVRKAYFKALEAHQAAQDKYDALRADIEQLRRPREPTSSTDKTTSSESSSTEYVALLRQKEKRRKLTVIERALSSIAPDESSSFPPNLEDTIKQKIGELPVPPNTQPTLSRDPEVEAKIMELKKAVVSTKRRVDQHRKKNAPRALQSNEPFSAEAEVAGLQQALQELTVWMEDHLTIIAEAEGESQAGANGTDDVQAVNEVHATSKDIEALYEQYLEARQKLVQNVNDFSAMDPQDNPADNEWLSEMTASRSTIHTQSSSKTNAAALAPYIATLVAAKQEEQALVQQSSFIRRQITTAEAETARLMQRLADESHLVHPGASKGRDWANAASGAAAATETSSQERLQDGESFATSAKEMRDNVQSLPDILINL